MTQQDDLGHFKKFANDLEKRIASYNEPDANAYDLQKRQMEELVALEDEFRRTLIDHRWGRATYKAFVEFIRDDRRNILDARPYFRARKELFTDSISPALKSRSEIQLFPFPINYQFIAFVMRTKGWHKAGLGQPIVRIHEKIKKLRLEIVEMNMPLAINRARIFQRHRRAHLTHMDLVQIACSGLMDAVDKFTLPFRKSFRGVIIGRIVGNFIEENSKTTLHFYPVDRRKIYRANKANSRLSGEALDFDKLAEVVNKKTTHRFSQDEEQVLAEDVKEVQKTDGAELAGLLSASGCLSLDSPPEEDDKDARHGNRWDVAPESSRPDVQAEASEVMERVTAAIATLSIFERKLLRLKGVSF